MIVTVPSRTLADARGSEQSNDGEGVEFSERKLPAQGDEKQDRPEVIHAVNSFGFRVPS
jgi:hypothetical protein